MFHSCKQFALASFFVALASSTAPAADPPPANELVGTWTLDLTKNSELKGSEDQPNQVTLVIEADSWKLTVVNEGGAQEIIGGYVSDATQTPKLLDVTVRGENEAQEFFALYEINRGKLHIGWRADGARPADLNGTVADGLIKVSFVRQKSE